MADDTAPDPLRRAIDDRAPAARKPCPGIVIGWSSALWSCSREEGHVGECTP